jgi:phospholipase C
MYAVAGRAYGMRTSPPVIPPPAYTLSTIFDYLNAASPRVPWRVFAGNRLFSMLRIFQNFELAGSNEIGSLDDFFNLASLGKLPNVTWLEPDYGLAGTSGENDDHPPTDILAGQRLVAVVYNTLLGAAHEAWTRTLFIVTYDEHGGIFDHVSPLNMPRPADDPADGQMTYGVRVPALIISPWVKAGGANHTIFDHTSILKTILQRFLVLPDGSVPPMHARVNAAMGLGGILSEPTARTDATPAPVPVLATPPATLSVTGAQALLGTSGTPRPITPAQPLNDYQKVLKSVADRVVERKGIP